MHTVEATLGVSLATFLFLVRRTGVPLQDARIEAACAAFDAAGAPVDQLGAALVQAVDAQLGGATPEEVAAFLQTLVGTDRVRTDLGAGADRLARLGAIRRVHFGHPLPWLAQIIDRTPDGEVGRQWVLVEAFDEVARVMDPNPWDDRADEREIPVNDFMVQWELAGCPSVRVV